MRQGVGKVRHLHVKQLWIQEAVAAGELVVVKVPRAASCADALTHAWTSADLAFWSEMGLRFSASAHQQQDSSSSTQGPVLQLLHLEAVAAGSPGWTSSPSTNTTTTMQGARWLAAKDPAPGGQEQREKGGSRAHTGARAKVAERAAGPKWSTYDPQRIVGRPLEPART